MTDIYVHFRCETSQLGARVCLLRTCQELRQLGQVALRRLAHGAGQAVGEGLQVALDGRFQVEAVHDEALDAHLGWQPIQLLRTLGQ